MSILIKGMKMPLSCSDPNDGCDLSCYFIIGVFTGLLIGTYIGVLIMDIWRDYHE